MSNKFGKMLFCYLLIHVLCILSNNVTGQNLAPIPTDNSSIFNYPDFSGRKVIIPPLIILEPSEHTIAFREGESFELPCAASGQPEPTYSWYWNELAFDPSGRDGKVAIQPGVGTLIFANPESLDEAIYQCIAKNQAGIAVSIKINVRLAILDSFPSESVRINRVGVGAALKLICVPPRSFPNPEVHWKYVLDNQQLQAIDYTDRVSIDPIGNLIFANVQRGDYRNNATYICVAYNQVMRQFTQGKQNKIIPTEGTGLYSAPTLAWHSPTQQFGIRGSNLTMKCIFYGNPTPRVSWTKIGSAVLPRSVIVASFGQELRFSDLQYVDEGTYECEGLNDAGQTPERRSFALKVESSPYWIEKPVSQDVSEGETVIFKCSGESKPEPDIKWFFNRIPVTNITKNPKIMVSQNQITFVNMTIKDAMVIQCNISNKHGYVFTNAYLNVLTEPPFIITKPAIGQKAAEGQTTELICEVQGSPKPFIVWTKGGEQLTGGRFNTWSNGSLNIKEISLVDAGGYTCTATNTFGTAEATGFLIVRRKTRIVTEPLSMMVHYTTEAKFTCTATTDPEEIAKLQIIWLKDDVAIDYARSMRVFQNLMDNSLTISGTIYLDTGKYTCSATNGIDTDYSSANLIVQAPPNPPAAVQVRCYNTNNQAEIWWQPGKENFAPILNFVVQYNTSFQPDLWYDISTNLSQNQRRIVVTMSPWGNYSFRVLARNKIGTSLPSSQSFNVCTTQSDVPLNNPENVIGEGDEPGNLVIFWTPMPKIEQNGPDFKYILTWIALDEPGALLNTETVGTSNAWHYIARDRYRVYQRFNISVKSSNSKGDSKANLNWVVGYSGEDIPRVAPTNFQVLQETLTSTSVNLTWTVVDTSPGSVIGMFRGYRVEYAIEQEYPFNVRFQDYIINEAPYYPRKRIVKRSVGDNNTISFQITRLPPNSNVVAVVRVLNKYFAGPISERIQFTTPEGLPGPPESLSVVVQGATHFVISWSPPREHNGILIGYNITYQAILGMNIGRLQYYDMPIGANGTQARATGLNPNTAYRIYIAASTKAGKGEPIFVDSVTSPSGLPDPPAFSIIDLNETFANISWNPSRTGVPGSVFYVQYKPREHYDWLRSPDEFMARHMALTSLNPGTTYQVRVVAKNGDGFEAASVWQEFITPGVAPGYFNLKASGWFYGIWISLFLIMLAVILLMLLKKFTDRKWDEKEAEIEDEIRRLQAEEAAERMGVFNNEAIGQSAEFEDDLKVPSKNEEYQDEHYRSRPMEYGPGPSIGYFQPQYSDFAGGYKVEPSPQTNKDTFV